MKLSDLQQYAIGSVNGAIPIADGGFVKVSDVAKVVEELERIYTLARSFVFEADLVAMGGILRAKRNALCEAVLQREPLPLFVSPFTTERGA